VVWKCGTEVAKAIGEETVVYVDNIYKYYVAYKLAARTGPKISLPEVDGTPKADRSHAK
jgi:hypothetical protein